MERYTIPELLTKAVFYPYRGEKLVDEETLREPLHRGGDFLTLVEC
jgi:hypothetical protein